MSEPAELAGRADFRRRWSRTHGDHDPAPGSVVDRWLNVAERLGRPLAARGVPADAVTAAGVAAAAGAALLAKRHPGAAGAAVVLSVVLDGVDGAVAVLTRSEGGRGFLLDSLADRAADALSLLALRRAGAREGFISAAEAATVALEYARARAAAGGFAEIGLVTVGERPARVLVAASGLLTGALLRSRTPAVVDLSAATVAGLAATGAAQFVRVALRELAAGDQPAT